MKTCYRLLTVLLLAAITSAGAAAASQVDGVRLFTEQDYSRLSITFDGPFTSRVETKAAEQLIFIRFEDAGIEHLQKQSYVYDNSPHIEGVSFLPLGENEIVARVQARKDFRLKTYETSEPYRFILEISPRTIPADPQPGQQNQQQEGRSYYQRGMDQMGAGSNQAALMSFRSSIRSGQQVADSYFQAGRIRLRMGEYDKAKINFSRAAGSQRYSGEASLYLSWLHYRNGDSERMKSSWREFVRRVPDAAGRFRIASANPEIDFRALEDAVSTPETSDTQQTQTARADDSQNNGPGHAWYFEQGVAAKQEGRLDAAAELLEKAAELDPSHSETHFQLGVVYKDMGRKQASARQFQLSLSGPSQADSPEEIGITGKLDDENIPPLNLPAKKTDLLAAAFEEVPVAENEPGETESADETETEVAGSVLPDQGGAPPAQMAENGGIAGIRELTAEMVDKYGIGLLRRQVMILTVMMGVIFLLTLAAGRIIRRRFGRRNKALAGPGLPMLSTATASAAGGSAPAPKADNSRPAAPTARNRVGVAEVLAKELESKRRTSRPAVEENEEAVELHLRPVGERGMYGADIARRIKEELSPDGEIAAPAASSALAGANRDDMQTRLIRQLRSKNWTISDIAQEMNLSREEIKWALAGNTAPQRENTAQQQVAMQNEAYGQARKLAARDRNRAAKVNPERIDREVDLELEINV